jgi:hypothetical protein
MDPNSTNECRIYQQIILMLVREVQELEGKLKKLQSQCQHVFLETTSPHARTCLKCCYSEDIYYRFS